jgi:hypothetical protein
MITHRLVIWPSVNSRGESLPGRFDGRIGERVTCRQTATPFCTSARALLDQGIAAPGDTRVRRLGPRMPSSNRRQVGQADGRRISTPRFHKWVAPQTRYGKTADIASPTRETNQGAIPNQPPALRRTGEPPAMSLRHARTSPSLSIPMRARSHVKLGTWR